MNLIDAIKSGRPFRRGDTPWYSGMPSSFTIGDILADDWQIQEPAVTITRTQFLKAAFESWNEKFGGFAGTGFAEDVARRLGLEG